MSEKDSPTYNFFRRNDNPLEVVHKKHAKFDIQNPVIGSLLKQINKSRVTEKGVKSALDKAPDPRVLDLEERYRKIFKDNNTVNTRQRPPSPPNYIDRFFDPPQPPPTSPPSPPPPPPPTPPFYPGGGDQFPFDNFPPWPTFPQSPPTFPQCPPPPQFNPELRQSKIEHCFPYTARMPPKKGD